MSLLVAAIEDDAIWMVADTAITGGTIDLRARVHEPKVRVHNSGRAIIGFVGDAELGSQLLNAACRAQYEDALELLRQGTGGSPGVEFAFGHFNQNSPELVHVANGGLLTKAPLYLGLKDAFEQFQKVKHAGGSPAPKAVTKLMYAIRDPLKVPAGLQSAIHAMWQVFAEREEHDVGGWAVPVVLTKDGARMCSYSFSTSDPFLDRAIPGTLVQPGTAQEGGFSFSANELGDRAGMTFYWLQNQRGVVFDFRGPTVGRHEFDGPPTTFKEKAEAALGIPIDLWANDKPAGPVRKLTFIRDQSGKPAMVIADHGNAISVSVLEVVNEFHATAALDIRESADKATICSPMDAKISTDHKSVTLKVGDSEISLNAAELSEVIKQLATARAELSDPVPSEPPKTPGTTENVQLDPAWRTEPSPHPGVPGIVLRLRDSGYGWITFAIPPHEALALGQWLLDSQKSR